MKILSLVVLVALASAAAPLVPSRPRGACCDPDSSGTRAAAVSVPALELVRELAGTWVELGEDGEPSGEVVSRFAVTAGGSAVLETLFPGTPKEMVSMYHAEEGALVLTHYCVMGNHPRMRATVDATTGDLVFTCTGEGLNFRSCAEVHHMHEGRLHRLGEDRIDSTWTPWEDGRPSEPHTFRLERVPER